MSDQPATILETSDDPKKLLQAALTLARSDKAQDHQTLTKHLQSMKVLAALNTEDEYNGQAHRLRIKRVLEELAKNREQSARDVIFTLTKSPVFLQVGGRLELLITATAVVRPAPPELIAFWDKHCQPGEDNLAPLVIEAAIENGSKPALELFEKHAADPRHEADRIDWFRSSVLTHRNQAALLQSCERLLAGKMEDEMKSELVDVLFDYKPEVWFTPAVNYGHPPMSAYGASARVQVRRIGEYVLKNLKLTKRQKEAVERMVEASKGGASPEKATR